MQILATWMKNSAARNTAMRYFSYTSTATASFSKQPISAHSRKARPKAVLSLICSTCISKSIFQTIIHRSVGRFSSDLENDLTRRRCKEPYENGSAAVIADSPTHVIHSFDTKTFSLSWYIDRFKGVVLIVHHIASSHSSVRATTEFLILRSAMKNSGSR